MTENANPPEPPSPTSRIATDSRALRELLGRDPTPIESDLLEAYARHPSVLPETRLSLLGWRTRTASAPGEGFGLEADEGLRLVLKAAAPARPLATDPRQDAAASLRNATLSVVALGATPIALAQTLQVGDLVSPRVRRDFAASVAGLGQYGNQLGIPLVASAIRFDPSLEQHPRSQAFCLGLLSSPKPRTVPSPTQEEVVLLVGVPRITDIPTTDPFLGKRLVDAARELFALPAPIEARAPGAAGILHAVVQTLRHRAGAGMDIDLTSLPAPLPPSLNAILLAPVDEGMLFLAPSSHLEEVRAILKKWALPWTELGRLTTSARIALRHAQLGQIDLPVASIERRADPLHPLSGEAPPTLEAEALVPEALPDAPRPIDDLRQLLAWPAIASQNWAYRQWDHLAGNRSLSGSGTETALIRLPTEDLPPGSEPSSAPAEGPPRERYLAITAVSTAHPGRLTAFEGGRRAVLQAAQNLACLGAQPRGLAVALDGGGSDAASMVPPQEEALAGLQEACQRLRIPAVDGCLLHRHPPMGTGPIPPIPGVAMVGHLETREQVPTPWFKHEGDAIILLGEPADPLDPFQGLGGSAYLQVVHGRRMGTPCPWDLEKAATLGTAVVSLIRGGGIVSAQGCREGGLAVALAAGCLRSAEGADPARVLGARVDLTEARSAGLRLDALLFGESPSRVVVTCAALEVGKILERARILGIPALRIGTVGGEQLHIQVGDSLHVASVQDLQATWWHALEAVMQT